MTKQPPINPEEYKSFLKGIKEQIQQAQIRAGLAVNRELVLLYWHIGKQILLNQNEQGWGSKVIDKLSKDLKTSFPDQNGYSPRNLKYMRAFADAYPEKLIVQQAAAQIPWFHNCVLLDKVKDHEQRLWYIQKTVGHGWSRNVLIHQIESGLYKRQGKALTNFQQTLPAPQSDLAKQILKDPYNFDFLSLGDDVLERDLEKGLLNHLKDFLIELKTTEFEPEYAGKMNFYLSAVDDLKRHKDDQPSIGLILCKSKNKVVVEYALRNSNRPIGISEYELTKALPEELKGSLPTIEELEQELDERDS